MNNALIRDLRYLADEHVCPVNNNCTPGFQSGAFEGWGWARNRVSDILRKHNSTEPPIPDFAVCFFRDGDKWCCVNADFENLQESPAGFGDTFDEALAELASARESITKPVGLDNN